MSRVLDLDAGSAADVVGFRSLCTAASVVSDLPPEAWRVIGGWMVRAWAETTGAGGFGRQTIDADLELMTTRAVEQARKVPDRILAEGFSAFDEPFHFRREDGTRIDLLVSPGSSREDPPRLGGHVVFEVEGSRLAFRLPPEIISVRCGGHECAIQIPSLAAALTIKTILVSSGRPARARDDAQDVATLLRAARLEPDPLLPDLLEHRRTSDVKRVIRILREGLGGETDRVAEWIAQELGARAALTAVADARWLLNQVAS